MVKYKRKIDQLKEQNQIKTIQKRHSWTQIQHQELVKGILRHDPVKIICKNVNQVNFCQRNISIKQVKIHIQELKAIEKKWIKGQNKKGLQKRRWERKMTQSQDVLLFKQKIYSNYSISGRKYCFWLQKHKKILRQEMQKQSSDEQFSQNVSNIIESQMIEQIKQRGLSKVLKESMKEKNKLDGKNEQFSIPEELIFLDCKHNKMKTSYIQQCLEKQLPQKVQNLLFKSSEQIQTRIDQIKTKNNLFKSLQISSQIQNKGQFYSTYDQKNYQSLNDIKQAQANLFDDDIEILNGNFKMNNVDLFILKRFSQFNKHISWINTAKHLNKSPKYVRERWKNYVNPILENQWTIDQKKLLVLLCRENNGQDQIFTASKYAKYLFDKSELQIKNYWYQQLFVVKEKWQIQRKTQRYKTIALINLEKKLEKERQQKLFSEQQQILEYKKKVQMSFYKTLNKKYANLGRFGCIEEDLKRNLLSLEMLKNDNSTPLNCEKTLDLLVESPNSPSLKSLNEKINRNISNNEFDFSYTPNSPEYFYCIKLSPNQSRYCILSPANQSENTSQNQEYFDEEQQSDSNSFFKGMYLNGIHN